MQDIVGAFVTDGSGVDAVYDDSGNTLTLQRGPLTINTQTGTSYTLVLADAPKFVTMSNASASTLTVPPNASVAFPTGTYIEGAQLGAGQVTLTPGSGVTINGTPGLKIAAQYGTFGLLKTATNTWLAMGRLAAVSAGIIASSYVAGASDYPTTVLADSPVGYWRLGEASGTNAADSSGNAHDGTWSGTGSPTLGVTGLITGGNTAATTSGATSGPYCALPSGVPNLGSTFTVEAWVKTSSSATDEHPVPGQRVWGP